MKKKVTFCISKEMLEKLTEISKKTLIKKSLLIEKAFWEMVRK